MFSLSCAWNSKLCDDAYGMVRQIKELGFGQIELSFALTKDFVCDIISMRDAGEIEITSVHNFCPIPEGSSPNNTGPDYYSLASLDETERKKAIETTKKTISTAARLKAKAVILHLGRVADIKDRTRQLAGVLENKPEYESIKAEMIKARRTHVLPYLDKAIMSLGELLDSAKKSDIALGIETRYYHYEIPSLEEIGIMLARFKDRHIGYWHDAGHAQLFENLGICKHTDFLDKYSQRTIGMHLHDIKGTDDHLAPLQGELDFSILKPYLTSRMLLVLEPHQPATGEDIKKGMRHLENIFWER